MSHSFDKTAKTWEDLHKAVSKLLGRVQEAQTQSREKIQSHGVSQTDLYEPLLGDTEAADKQAEKLPDTKTDVKTDAAPQTQKDNTEEVAISAASFVKEHEAEHAPQHISSEGEVSISSTKLLGGEWDFLFAQDFSDLAPPAQNFVVPDISPTLLPGDSAQDQIVKDPELVNIVVEELQELLPDTADLLERMDSGQKNVIPDLHRMVHTLKGTVGQVGAYRARAVIHQMETVMEELEAGRHDPQTKKSELLVLFNVAQDYLKPLLTGEWASSPAASAPTQSNPADTAPQTPRTVRVAADTVDKLAFDVNESRLTGMSLNDNVVTLKHTLKDLEENAQRVFHMLRDLELQAEIEIQSRSTQMQQSGGDFDPLEFDRFTRLQELSRLTGEGLADILEVRREISRTVTEQEALLARQQRAIQSTQDSLHKTRLTPVDAINDRLHNVVWTTSREEGKGVSFELVGGRVELDRVLLEKIIPPLDHILRNSVVHGIEDPQERINAGKPEIGTITVAVRQEAGRAFISVSDDGVGLRTEKIRQKAVEKGLWDANSPMSDNQAADMICTPRFSTADVVSQRAGRGVGMDVVRSKILEMGGRFEITSRHGQGLDISIQLPTSIATASVLVVESGNENWAFPIEIVEHVILMKKEDLAAARSSGLMNASGELQEWHKTPFRSLDTLTGVVSAATVAQDTAPVLLLKERGKLMALEATRLAQVYEVPLRPAGTIFGHVRGVAGTVILPSGDAVFLLDPFRFANADRPETHTSILPAGMLAPPLVLVVDDSLTVRKATTRFLQRQGYESVTAKDGQEALELLLRLQPQIILMDIEMPRMDGFDCTKNIRDNPKTKNIPVVMITSRTAPKHRAHALELGANEYLGKPFKEHELLEILHKYAPRPKAVGEYPKSLA